MSNANRINTLSEFLLQAQTQYMVFDLGRGLRSITNQTFFEWENQQAPCAYPRQDHAWFCIAFWNEQLGPDYYIWYVKLPVDENGLMIQASRNQFLEIIVTALGTQLQHSTNQQATLPENPYIFKPSQQQLADCNAHIRAALHFGTHNDSVNNSLTATPFSSKVEQTGHYMKAPSVQEWQTLTVQDMADYVCAIQDSDNCAVQAVLALNIRQYPHPVLSCVFASLESKAVNANLSQSILDLHSHTPETQLSPLCLRALSYRPVEQVVKYIEALIKSSTPMNIETCVVIAGRYWQLLSNEDILLAYMHKVALADTSYALFHGIYADVVKVPSSRASMLRLLRNTKRSDEVAKGIGQLFNA